MRVITFYYVEEEYGCFSNFARYPIKLKGKIWLTSEHYFQAQKFAGTEHEEAIRLATSPKAAAKMGRDCRKPLRPDWEVIKDDIMREAVFAKFTQHAELQGVLLSTGEAILVEHTASDCYWGDCGNGQRKKYAGKNSDGSSRQIENLIQDNDAVIAYLFRYLGVKFLRTFHQTLPTRG